jgi:hypothetical protein
MGSITVCPVHIFPPPTELLVCYQPHRQEVMPGQKSIYETFLCRTVTHSNSCCVVAGRDTAAALSYTGDICPHHKKEPGRKGEELPFSPSSLKINIKQENEVFVDILLATQREDKL